MHRRRVIRKIEVVFQSFAKVVRIQDGVQRRSPQAISAMREDVRERPNQDAEVTVEGPHAPNRLRPIVIPGPAIGAGSTKSWSRQEWFENLLYGDRTCSGTSAPVWGREGFVQIQVHYVDA